MFVVCCRFTVDGILQAGGAPGGAGAGGFAAAAAQGGVGRQQIDAGAGEFGQARAQGFREHGEERAEAAGEGFGVAAEVEAELEAGLVGEGEELELVEGEPGAAQPDAGVGVEQGEEGFGGAPEDGRGDGALGDGEKGRAVLAGVGLIVALVVVAGGADVAGAELAVDGVEGEADAVAVGERRGGVELEFGEGEAGGGEQGAEAGGLCGELRGVGEVLELASAAGAEVRAEGHGCSFFVVRCSLPIDGIHSWVFVASRS